MCAICHGNIQPNSVALVRGCDHAFCSLCILNWATQKRRCPLCLVHFSHLWVYRRIDGSYNDYLVEESVDLLHCSVWFKREVSHDFVPQTDQHPSYAATSAGGGPEAEDEDDYHEMLQYLYGGGYEDAEQHAYYDEMQEGLERRGGRSNRSFGQRRWGSGGFVSAGGARLAARVPPTPSPKPNTTPKWSKKGFAAGVEEAGSSSGTQGSSSSSSSGASSGSGKKAADRKAEKQALKEAQKEKRRSWAGAATN